MTDLWCRSNGCCQWRVTIRRESLDMFCQNRRTRVSSMVICGSRSFLVRRRVASLVFNDARVALCCCSPRCSSTFSIMLQDEETNRNQGSRASISDDRTLSPLPVATRFVQFTTTDIRSNPWVWFLVAGWNRCHRGVASPSIPSLLLLVQLFRRIRARHGADQGVNSSLRVCCYSSNGREPLVPDPRPIWKKRCEFTSRSRGGAYSWPMHLSSLIIVATVDPAHHCAQHWIWWCRKLRQWLRLSN